MKSIVYFIFVMAIQTLLSLQSRQGKCCELLSPFFFFQFQGNNPKFSTKYLYLSLYSLSLSFFLPPGSGIFRKETL